MKEKQIERIVLLIQRIIGFPFFAVIGLIGVMVMWIRWMCNFAKYGGEAIAYTKTMNKKTIKDIFDKLNIGHNDATKTSTTKED